MKINRDELLNQLLTVEGGLSQPATVDQSDCFVFQKGMVLTYNDEVACRTKCCLPVTGAVNANALLGTLCNWPSETIEFKRTDSGLRFRGKSSKKKSDSGLLIMAKDILLPVKDIEAPKGWEKLPKEFERAVKLVGGCVSKRSSSPHLCCIHFLPDGMEACDGVQAGRFTLKLPFKDSTLLQKNSLRWVIEANATTVSITKNWVHFKNEAGLIISCHKYIEDYPTDKLTAIFKTKGNPAVLPKEIKELVKRVDYMLDDTSVSQWLIVEIDSKHIKIKGTGKSGNRTVKEEVKYKGDPIAFNINPVLLQELGKEHDKCRISKNNIKIKKDRFQYISSLWMPSVKEED